MDRCRGLNFNCQKCKRHFKRSERVETCPDCGTDLHCEKPAVPGYKFCERHGGPAPSRNFYGKGRGIVSGEGSQFALTRLAATYLEMTKDGMTLSNRAGIQVLDKRISLLLDRLEKGEYPDQLITLHNLWKKFLELRGTLEEKKIEHKLTKHFEAIYHDYMATTEIRESLELRRKMAESEAKIAKDLHAILTAEDAYKLVAKLQAAIISAIQQEPEIKDNVKAHFLKRIEYEFTRIIGEGSGEGTGGGLGEIIDA